MSVDPYHELRLAMGAGLRREADAHEAGDLEAVGAGYDFFDGALPRGAGPEYTKQFMVLEFWDDGGDERNHGWPNFYGITQDQWPLYARKLAADLEADREVSDPFLQQLFTHRHERRSWWRWLFGG